MHSESAFVNYNMLGESDNEILFKQKHYFRKVQP